MAVDLRIPQTKKNLRQHAGESEPAQVYYASGCAWLSADFQPAETGNEEFISFGSSISLVARLETENLKDAAAGRTEWTTMCADFAKVAEEGFCRDRSLSSVLSGNIEDSREHPEAS